MPKTNSDFSIIPHFSIAAKPVVEELSLTSNNVVDEDSVDNSSSNDAQKHNYENVSVTEGQVSVFECSFLK